MKKEDLEYAKIQNDGQKFSSVIDLIKFIVRYGTYLAAIWLIFEGLKKILVGQDSDGILAIAKVIDALKIGSILGYVFGFGATAAWSHERKGKKRAIREKNKYQKIAERMQPNRISSGLNEDGSTPIEDDDE